MNFNGQQIQQIQQAFLTGFSNQNDLAMMVRFHLDINLLNIAGGDTLNEVIFGLITWAEHNGKLVDIVKGAARYLPDNIEIQTIAQDIQKWDDDIEIKNNGTSSSLETLTSYYTAADKNINALVPNGFRAPTQNNIYVSFQSEKLVLSLLRLGIPLHISLNILGSTVTNLNRKLSSNEQPIEGSSLDVMYSTADIRDAVVKSIYQLSNEHGIDTVQRWGDRYARRYGGAGGHIQVIHEDGKIDELSFGFIKHYLLPDIFQSIFDLNFNDFRGAILSQSHLSAMAETLVEYIRAIDLYHVRYTFLSNLVIEVGIQPPHPWFAPDTVARRIMDYDLEKIARHQLSLKQLTETSDVGAIYHSCKELVHHSCSLILCNYESYLGCFDLAPLDVLINLIEYHSRDDVSDSEAFFKFSQFLGDLYSSLNIDHEQLLFRLRHVERKLSSSFDPSEANINSLTRMCEQLSQDLTSLVNIQKDIRYSLINYEEEFSDREDILKLARNVLLTVSGIRFPPQQDNVNDGIYWAYHDIRTPLFDRISPKFAISAFGTTPIDNAEEELRTAMEVFTRVQSINADTMIIITAGEDLEHQNIRVYVDSWSTDAKLYFLPLDNLVSVLDSINRLDTLTEILLTHS
ncbi:MAG: hypothetical protein H6642_08825 [Caldilineaceae bacterium]|nr:hypothetical protein [Caldilineaceae bacterium]